MSEPTPSSGRSEPRRRWRGPAPFREWPNAPRGPGPRWPRPDRAYAESLAEIHRAADLTQVALATQMGVAQTVVSRLERQHDMLLSTLTGYLQAAGDHPRIVGTVNGHDVELDLAALVR
jgi:hypothetical protein